MRFSIFHAMGAPGDVDSYPQHIEHAREFDVAAEKYGFWSTWYTEHHFGHEGQELTPNPILMGVDIAARTSTIRIGQAASIVTYWHPLRLAEDLALLDQLSGGRLEVGVGRGIYGREALNLNPAADPRDQEKNRALFAETMQVLQEAWGNRFFAHKGDFYEFPVPGVKWSHPMSPSTPDFTQDGVITRLSLVPRPVQEKLNIWQVIDTPRSIIAAADTGVQGIFWMPPVSELKGRFQLYQEHASAAQGRDVPLGEGIALVRDVYVADTMEQARADFEEAVLNTYRWVTHWRGLGNLMNAGEQLTDEHKLDFDFLMERNLLVGTPEFVADKIRELQRELGLEHMMLWTTHPGLEHAKAMNSLRLFSQKVMPHFV